MKKFKLIFANCLSMYVQKLLLSRECQECDDDSENVVIQKIYEFNTNRLTEKTKIIAIDAENT